MQVRKLQAFLMDTEELPVAVNGIFDRATYYAVVAYQERYRDAILSPWGITYGTGYVYHTTRKHINEQYCEGDAVFPLSASQQMEIGRFSSQ